jgi:sugar phosphate isomerase/epimerase
LHNFAVLEGQGKAAMIPTLFSVSYAGLWGQHTLDLPTFVRKAARLGYQAVELMGKRPHLSVVDTDDRLLRDVRSAADGEGIEIATIAGYTDFTLGRLTETPAVEMQVAYVRQLARCAEQLGAKIVRIFTGYTVQAEAYQRDWEICVGAIRECARIAGDHGVTIGLQNHHDVGVGLDAYVEFLDDVDHPNCRAMFDPWSIALQGEDLPSAAQRLAPRMVQTTLADYVRLKRFAYQPGLVNYKSLDAMVRAVPLGEGFLDLGGFFAGLAQGGFDGYVAFEMCSPLRGGGSEENLDATATASLRKIRELIGAT